MLALLLEFAIMELTASRHKAFISAHYFFGPSG